MAGESESKKTGRQLGHTGETVRANVKRIRDDVLRISQAELSRRLGDLGRPMPALGIQRIEAGTRRVDADDLVALSVALKVSPTVLLMPVADESDAVSTTGSLGVLAADRLWAWLTSDDAAPQFHETRMAFIYRVCPPWVARRKDRENAERLARELAEGHFTPRDAPDGDNK